MSPITNVLHFILINSVTGNMITNCLLPAAMDEESYKIELKARKAAIALSQELSLNTIYWEPQQTMAL